MEINRQLGKNFKFDQMKLRYKYNQESVLHFETYKLFWNIEIQTDQLISARRPVHQKKEPAG